jgi:hypothetical protein
MLLVIAVVIVGRKEVLESGALSKHVPSLDATQLKAMLDDVQVHLMWALINVDILRLAK